MQMHLAHKKVSTFYIPTNQKKKKTFFPEKHEGKIDKENIFLKKTWLILNTVDKNSRPKNKFWNQMNPRKWPE